MKKNKIFISIASYRDPELIPTIENCIENADNPKNLVFGISRQYHPDESFDDLKKYKKKKNFRIIETLYNKSVGVCHARHQIQGLYQDEEYYFQLDSHHRFIKGWDTKLKSTLKELSDSGSEKPLLTAYLPSYDPDKKDEDRLNDVWRMYIDRFMPEGPIFIFPESIQDFKSKSPEKARFTSGHFIFTLGKFCKEVPYDPKLYFHGEESSLGARAYTWGYDLYHLHRPWVWHHYTRDGKARHWDDVSKWNALNKQSFDRYRKLFGMDGTRRQNFPKYGFGKVRSLKDYEIYSGISFKDRRIQQHTLDRKVPPTPFKSKSEYENNFVSKFKYCIDVHKPSFTEEDYDVWVIAFKDKNGEEMVRLDADEQEVKSLLNGNPDDDFVRLWREFETSELPHSWLIWPHSKSKDWMNIIEGEVPVDA
tara:strand:+ start:9737 stop:10999 length:1263 start_codon:yes stop_codon:yes gene_type:complete